MWGSELEEREREKEIPKILALFFQRYFSLGKIIFWGYFIVASLTYIRAYFPEIFLYKYISLNTFPRILKKINIDKQDHNTLSCGMLSSSEAFRVKAKYLGLEGQSEIVFPPYPRVYSNFLNLSIRIHIKCSTQKLLLL